MISIMMKAILNRGILINGVQVTWCAFSGGFVTAFTGDTPETLSARLSGARNETLWLIAHSSYDF
ncbi:hypothetical protein [Yokenella regensburgei]|uniref:hypothetical protein n=1 Tax=Yokenella regensburgei TaxID=158877 RepID=UPI0013763A6A|nr:hypothetical protein [Yokenella regensburgei]KAF1371382.1 hypothetical protein FHR25_000509 [Yokenella regensburgei]